MGCGGKCSSCGRASYSYTAGTDYKWCDKLKQYVYVGTSMLYNQMHETYPCYERPEEPKRDTLHICKNCFYYGHGSSDKDGWGHCALYFTCQDTCLPVNGDELARIPDRHYEKCPSWIPKSA